MALLPCAECGHQISDKAVTCPNCGAPVNITLEREAARARKAGVKKKAAKGRWKTVVFASILIALLAIGYLAPEPTPEEVAESETTEAAREAEREAVATEREVAAAERAALRTEEDRLAEEERAERERRAQAEREAANAERARIEEQRVAAAQARETEDRQKGFHCLSGWNGAHSGVVRRVRSTLRNPDSFEHIETRVAPIDDSGLHRFFMQYRAENGFGGMNIEVAEGTYANADCNEIVLR